MIAEQVRKAREKAPFKPFTIHQRHYEILHPDLVWVIPGGRTIGVADEHGAVELVDLLHVTSLKLKGGEEP